MKNPTRRNPPEPIRLLVPRFMPPGQPLMTMVNMMMMSHAVPTVVAFCLIFT